MIIRFIGLVSLKEVIIRFPAIRFFYFVDEQLKGPYSYWHHKHTFKEVDGGILIIDEITYALPIQAFRMIVHPVLIKPQLNQIFDFRFQTIKDKFK